MSRCSVVPSAWRRRSCSRYRQRLEVLPELAALRGARNRDSNRPGQCHGSTNSQAVLKEATARHAIHGCPLGAATRIRSLARVTLLRCRDCQRWSPVRMAKDLVMSFGPAALEPTHMDTRREEGA